MLVLLFIEGEHVIDRDSLGRQLQALAPALVSKRAGRAFIGYVEAQQHALIGQATRKRERSAEQGV